MYKLFSLLLCIIPAISCSAIYLEDYPLDVDSIQLSDPFVLADKDSGMYYMTGTGGKLWKSPDLKHWSMPKSVVEVDSASWMGATPEIWAAELHKYNDKYYYFATFYNHSKFFMAADGRMFPRRACHVLVSDSPEGPYRAISSENYLPADKLTLDATLWLDSDNILYMVYCHEWVQNNDGTVEKIALKPDFSSTYGDYNVLFRASDSPWSREVVDGVEGPNRVTDGPYVFSTSTGRLGMIWTSWVYNIYTQGVAYSESGTLDGPWVQSPNPITPPNYGHGMIFTDVNGRTLLACHSHQENGGRYIRRPVFFSVSLEGDELNVMEKFE